MKDKTVSEALKRQDWAGFTAFEKIGLFTLFAFFAFMIFMFFIMPKMG